MLEYFPDPYPDEILYSVWARLSDRVRSQSKQEVLRELFGSKHYRGGVDLPVTLALLLIISPLDIPTQLIGSLNVIPCFPFIGHSCHQSGSNAYES